MQVLQSLGLETLSYRHRERGIRPEELSPGERQRLNMARILFHKPKYAVVDEITSHVGEEVEEQFYCNCERAGITMISVGHRASLSAFHSHQLTIHGDGTGGWSVRTL